MLPEDVARTGIICGTGPSLTPAIIEQCKRAKSKGIRLFGCNDTIFSMPLNVHAATNTEWWDYYGPQTENLFCDMWTPREEVPQKFPWVRWIEERNAPGLSMDPSYIHHHHGSGPIILNIAYHYGIRRFLLVGWDMRHKGRRHYFGNGEYPESMRHVTRNLGPNGELIGLIAEMETIKPEQYGIEIINCSEGSAMTCFPSGNLEDYV